MGVLFAARELHGEFPVGAIQTGREAMPRLAEPQHLAEVFVAQTCEPLL